MTPGIHPRIQRRMLIQKSVIQHTGQQGHLWLWHNETNLLSILALCNTKKSVDTLGSQRTHALTEEDG